MGSFGHVFLTLLTTATEGQTLLGWSSTRRIRAIFLLSFIVVILIPEFINQATSGDRDA